MLPNAPDEPIESTRDLVDYFHSAAKPPAAWRVGIEQEKIPVLEDGTPAPYDGPQGIAAVLAGLEAIGYHAQREDGHIVSLERNDERITVEPGGQLELSGPALRTAAACRDVLVRHVREVAQVGGSLGIRFIGGGFRPFGTLDEVPWLPKRRYAVMRSYLPTRGRLAHEMMKRTATVQANFDYSDEADAVDKVRMAFGVTPIVTALWAASSISAGAPNGFKSYRAAVWLETDEDRCGLLPFVFEPGFAFAHYVEYALDVPMFFVVRQGVYHPADGVTFRRFLAQGWRGQRATIHDWEVHLSTLFPEVRLKRYVEVRGADSGPLTFAAALGALWRGLLEDPDARRAAWRLVAGWSYAERERLRREVPRAGLSARAGGRSLAELALELCRIARAGLLALPDGAVDAPLLDPVTDHAAQGRCPADDMLADWQTAAGDPRKLVAAWDLAPGV